jgi:hypothetical protein
MRSKTRSFLALLAIAIPLWGSVPGCSQPDNPAPEKAPPPPAAKPEEVAVPKKGTTGKAYGSGDRYRKAMEKQNNAGGS